MVELESAANWREKYTATPPLHCRPRQLALLPPEMTDTRRCNNIDKEGETLVSRLDMQVRCGACERCGDTPIHLLAAVARSHWVSRSAATVKNECKKNLNKALICPVILHTSDQPSPELRQSQHNQHFFAICPLPRNIVWEKWFSYLSIVELHVYIQQCLTSVWRWYLAVI